MRTGADQTGAEGCGSTFIPALAEAGINWAAVGWSREVTAGTFASFNAGEAREVKPDQSSAVKWN